MKTLIEKISILALFCVILSSCNANENSEKPNVLVILLDDAGYNDFGFMGSKVMKTPNIDALANAGIICSDAHVSGTSCSPSRAGMITGRYQQRFGHEENVPPMGKGMDPSEKTIGDAFSSEGYKTIYIGKWHLGSTEEFYPTNRGWDEFFGLREGHRSYFPDPKENKHKAIEHNGEYVKWDGYVTDLFTETAIKYIDESKEKPFFMFLSYTAPHTPMHAKEEHLKMFEGHERQKLAAMLWSVDEGIGRVINHLEKLNLKDNTLVFFLSDNGGPTANGSDNGLLKGHKGDKFEGGQRTPFIVSWPAKLPQGKTYGGLISALDIYPTSAVAAGVPLNIGKPLDGVDIKPYLLGEKEGEPHDVLFWHRSVERAIRMGDYKLIGHEDHGFRLYNLENDIEEMVDLSEKYPEKVKQMKTKFATWEEELASPMWEGNKDWKKVKSEIYRALLNNDKQRYSSPGAMKRYLKNNPEQK